MNTSGQVQTIIKELYDEAKGLYKYNQKALWKAYPKCCLILSGFYHFWDHSSPLLLMFGPCLFNMLVKFVFWPQRAVAMCHLERQPPDWDWGMQEVLKTRNNCNSGCLEKLVYSVWKGMATRGLWRGKDFDLGQAEKLMGAQERCSVSGPALPACGKYKKQSRQPSLTERSS
jgi:hypothetical protein